MTQEKFEQAKMLESRIKSISELIELFSVHQYELKPPTRMSNYAIWRGSQREIDLNEAEAILFLNALKDEKNRLLNEFGRL